MIIVSQDKTEIINFDNTLRVKLFINDDDKDEQLYEIYAEVIAPGDNYILLGTYYTEERAKEVLQEIIQCYKDTNYEYENCWCLRNVVYEMPKK